VQVAAVSRRLPNVLWHNDATGQPVMRSLIAYDH
jgi:hypothetical protein